MGSSWIPQLATVLVTFTALSLLITVQWRISILLLVLQYGGVFLLTRQAWPAAMAAAQLIAGWIACLVLALTLAGLSPAARAYEEYHSDSQAAETTFPLKPSRLFFVLAAILVAVIIYSRLPDIRQWFPGLTPTAAWGGLILIALGILRLGYVDRAFSTFLGLLTMLSGFDVLYAFVQSSLLLTGLLAGIHLSLALAGAYLLVAARPEGSP